MPGGPYLSFLQGLAADAQVPVFNATTGKFEAGNQAGGAVPSGTTLHVSLSGSNTSYNTITAALAACLPGDSVICGPGTYPESVTIPDGVGLAAQTDLTVTVAGELATGTRITLGDQTSVTNIIVLAPTDAEPAIVYNGAETASVLRVLIRGQGAAGIGISMRGTGTLNLAGCALGGGDLDTFLEITSGTMFAGNSAISLGTVAVGLSISGGASCDLSTFAISSSVVVTDGVRVADGTLLGQVFDLRGTNCLHVTDNAASVDITTSKFSGPGMHLLVDPGLTAGTFHLVAAEMDRDKISAPGVWLSDASVAMTFQDEVVTDEAFVFWSEVHVGQPEHGRELIGGEGGSYARGIKVVTSDDTATATTEGGNLTDVSAEARDPTSGTFSFQGVTANHCIYSGSTLEDASDVVKHWGLEILQTIAAVEVTPISFICELWDGAAWVAFGCMTSHATLFHRYANTLFIRTNTTGVHRYGIDGSVTWVKKTIDGNDLFWTRIRIATTITTAPVFQQFKLDPSHAEFNVDGTPTLHGAARFRATLASQVNNGEAGVVGNSGVVVGSGGSPTGWTQVGRNNLMNNDGDELFYVYTFTRGIDTSAQLRFHAAVSTERAGGAVTLIVSALPLEAAGVMIADPAGGTTPIARTIANTETFTDKAAVAVSSTMLDSSVVDKMQRIDFVGGYDISDYYEGDAVLIRLELDVSNSTDVIVWELAVEGVNWTLGEKIIN